MEKQFTIMGAMAFGKPMVLFGVLILKMANGTYFLPM
jgi:hypothetical protein